MVDLVSIGVSGLSAYQRALATTSNNIANLQTEGYVRQRALLEAAGQDNTSRISLGNGVRFAEIQRLYDRFAEENLQRAASALKSEEVLLTELQSLQDSIGSSEAGLHSAFQAFFDSARELEASPASPGSRAGFLSSSEGLAARFRGLADAVATQDGTTRTQMEQAIGEANILLKELAGLNTELLKRGSDAEQPMQLLDRRDAALKSLAEKLGISIELSNSGAVNIYSGDSTAGIALVEGNRARALSVNFDPYDFGKVQFVLDAASQPVVLSNVRTGALGGLASFRSQALGTASEKLDELALNFGRAVNKLHRQGLDSLGRPGQDVFYVGPDFVVDGRANAGSARLGVEIADTETVAPNRYDMRFDEVRGLWALRNQTTGAAYELRFDVAKQTWAVKNIGTNQIVSDSAALVVEGLRFNLQGTPKNGDSFRVSPESHPALTLRSLLKEGSEVASAAKLMTKAASGNDGTASADIILGPPRTPSSSARLLQELLPESSLPGRAAFASALERKETEVRASESPIAVIKAGTNRVALSVNRALGGELAIFTRDGRQISGPAIPAEMVAQTVTSENGFFAGATYSTAYLNKTGEPNGYLDRTFIRGSYAEAGSQVNVDGERILTPATLYGEPITLGNFEGLDSFDLVINGKTVTIDVPEALTDVQQLASAINAHTTSTRVVAETTGDNRLVFKSYNELVIPGASIDTADTVVVRDKNNNITARYVGGKPLLTIGPVEFTVELGELEAINDARSNLPTPLAPLTSKQYLRDQINESGLGLQASIATDGSLVIRNIVGKGGEPINIGDNRLGLTEGLRFNSDAVSVGAPATDETTTIVRNLGLRSGFAMAAPLAEDLLVFGVNDQGLRSKVVLTGTYELGDPPPSLSGDARDYTLTFNGGNYSLVDKATNTEVAAGEFDTTTRAISYANWTITMSAIPVNEDSFTITTTDDPLGDNRIISAIANLQFSRDVLESKQTVQQDYENLVNRVGAIVVQAEVAQEAQKVVFDHAKEGRDRVSGVNLDEELADLLRFQQAYQANAQVVQVANRLFDSLLQRL